MNTQSPVNPLLRVEQYPIAALKPYEKNSKIHDKKQVKQIAASIREFGFNVPILIDGENNIIAGHGRVTAFPWTTVRGAFDSQRRNNKKRPYPRQQRVAKSPL